MPETITLKEYQDLVPESVDPKKYLTMVKDMIVSSKLSVGDFQLFLYVCKRTKLDPLTKQIYAIPYWDSQTGAYKMTVFASIDGMRLVAQRSGQYLGQDDIVFDPVDESLPHPKKATCSLTKVIGGVTAKVTATARWSEYAQVGKDGKLKGLWAKMPYTMLGKCAEALALRKAFPNDLSGIYSDVEFSKDRDAIEELPKPEKTETIVKPTKDVVAERNALKGGDK